MFDKTVNFDLENSWSDFGIVFKTLTLGAPDPQLILIDVPFRDGSLDETDYFGDVKYKDRNLQMEFLIPWWADDQLEIYSNVLNRLNGKRKKIRFSADKEWFYEGRLSVGDASIDNGFWKFSISATVDPYKYKEFSVLYDVNGELNLSLFCDKMSVCPTFATDGAIKVEFNGATYDFQNGLFVNPLIRFKHGMNDIKITSQSKVKVGISYKQGRL